MSHFRNIRIYPNHGSRKATVTWEMSADAPAGVVYVAFSFAGTQGSWEPRNALSPVVSTVGMFADTDFVMNAGTLDGFYRLMLIATVDDAEYKSEPIQIAGDIMPHEYGVIRGMIHREYTQMRTANGYPVWHCIPRAHGEASDNVDPDTDTGSGIECDTDSEDAAYSLAFEGGFYPPVLTWMRVIQHAEGLQDDPDSFSTKEIDQTSVRLMAFPRPRRGHMIVDPTTDRRYLVTGEVKPARFRGIVPIAYNATLEFLSQSDPRHKFDTPAIDTKAYRKIPYWSPEIA